MVFIFFEEFCVKVIDGGVTAAKGFKAAGVFAGLKKEKKDMALIYSKAKCTVSGTFTTNIVKAAPVVYDKQILDLHEGVHAVLINSKCANACTGKKGYDDCISTSNMLARALGIKNTESLLCSTGIIGTYLMMDRIEDGITLLVKNMDSDRASSRDAAMAICTTDTYEKEVAVSFLIDGKICHMGGMAKGSGMIHPNMATTLAFITTDVEIDEKTLNRLLGGSIEDTFNMVSVDGDTSTNDTVLVLANGEAGNSCLDENSSELSIFKEALDYCLETLAKELVRDGEGATKFISVKVSDAESREDAKKMARSVVSSSLFKAAMFGSDANWGRALCAMGYSGGNFNPDKVELAFSSKKGNIKVLENGTPLKFDESLASSVLSEKEIEVLISCNMGPFSATAWGCDLSYEYVKINGDYRS